MGMIAAPLAALGGFATSSTGLTLLGVGATALLTQQAMNSAPSLPAAPAVVQAPEAPTPAAPVEVDTSDSLQRQQDIRRQRNIAITQQEEEAAAISGSSQTAVSLTQQLLGK